MGIFWKAAGLSAAAFALNGCVIVPYQTAFSSCDAEAGACYRYCEQFEGTPDYQNCHSDCEADANQCFAAAYDEYRYAQSSYGGYGYSRPSPWYGRYGQWYPDRGYYFGFGYGSGYGYNDPRYGGYDRRRRDRHDDDRNDNPPPPTAPRSNPRRDSGPALRDPDYQVAPGEREMDPDYNRNPGANQPPPPRPPATPAPAPSRSAPPPTVSPPPTPPRQSSPSQPRPPRNTEGAPTRNE